MKTMEFISNKKAPGDSQQPHSSPQAYEKCVVCGKTTDVPVSSPVSARKCYMTGAGQLCRECCITIYGTEDLRWLL